MRRELITFPPVDVTVTGSDQADARPFSEQDSFRAASERSISDVSGLRAVLERFVRSLRAFPGAVSERFLSNFRALLKQTVTFQVQN